MIKPSRNLVTRRVVMSPRLEALRDECERAKAVGLYIGLGNRLTEILARYQAMVEHYVPRVDFTSEEWIRVRDVLIENWPGPDVAVTPEHLATILRQAGEEAIAAKVRSFDLVETVALMEAIYREEIAMLERGELECRPEP